MEQLLLFMSLYLHNSKDEYRQVKVLILFLFDLLLKRKDKRQSSSFRAREMIQAISAKERDIYILQKTVDTMCSLEQSLVPCPSFVCKCVTTCS